MYQRSRPVQLRLGLWTYTLVLFSTPCQAVGGARAPLKRRC
jgi:hypothetical protein